ncbi:hypothetical protein CK203_048574 [Vitis vinifera]|uniref:Uncharacterized protein n=1 Tax=Vitis vinifera TaxID=29760 RepID=A0A438HK30_VITVI|nr:hypothetical protein CK203_048574 [Vitis vinifera]
MARFTYLVMDDLVSSGFLTYHTSDAILGAINIFSSAFRAISIFSSAFRAIIVLSFGIQSHYRSHFRHSEPSSFSFSAFKATIPSQFQRSKSSSFSVLAFRAIIASQLRHSEPSTFLVRCSEQSLFSVSALRAIIASQLWHSEPSTFSIRRSEPLSFSAIIAYRFRHLEPSSLLNFGVQRHHRFSTSAFRAIIIFSSTFRAIIILDFGVRAIIASHSAFRVIMSFFGSAFRATIFLQFNVQSHHLSPIQHSESLSSYCLVFKVTVPFTAWHSKLSSYHDRAFVATFSTYRAYSFRHLESSSFILLAFRVVSPQPCHSESWLRTFIFTNIAPLTFMALCSSWFFFLTSLPCVYRLFVIALPDFPFHYS